MKISLISTNTYPGDQGLRYVSSILKKNKFDVEMLFLVDEENYKKVYSKKVLEQVYQRVKGSKIVGISSMASTSIRAEQLIKFLKKRIDCLFVWGGVHATISPDKCLKTADIVCLGEGEYPMLDLAKAVDKGEDYSKIKNLWIKKEGKIIKNDIRKLEENLDNYPWPDYNVEEHFILDREKLRIFRETDFGGMLFYQTERGCPNACTYCINKRLKDLYKGKGKIIRTHSNNYVIGHLKYIISKYKSIGVIDLRDEVFFTRKVELIKDFCEKYKKEIGLRMKCLTDAPCVDEEKLRLMVNAGLTDIIIGIQGTEKVNFEIYKRYIKDEQVLRAAKILNKFKNKLCVMYDVITCNPYETNKDVLDMIHLLIKLPKPFFLSVNNLVFFIGSELYDRAVKDGYIKSLKDSAFDLNYWDRWKHIKLKKKNEYLVLVLNLMRGVVTNKKYGLIPKWYLKWLIKPKTIRFFNKHKWLVYIAGSKVQIMDFFRENIAKPIFRSMPNNFRVWYDKVRYR